MRLFFHIGLVAVVTLVGCQSTPEYSRQAHETEVSEWQEWRLMDLTREDSWLTLVGYDWLAEGTLTVGAGADSDIKLPRGPDVVGRFEVSGTGIRFMPAEGADVVADSEQVPEAGIDVATSGQDGTTVFRMNDMSWFVRDFQDRLAVRVRDNRAPLRVDFPGLNYYAVTAAWRLEARYEPYDPPKRFPVAIFTGGDDMEESPGAVVFEIGGETYRLDVTDTSETGYFVIFSDGTSRDDTYPAGRYVWFDKPEGEAGPVILDFNKSYNPPCAFTEFATCPLPPRSHRIDARIEAGELRFDKA